MLEKPFVNCLNISIVIKTMNPKMRFDGDPRSAAPTPPPKYFTPMGISERPIASTTVPVTSGGKYFLKGFKKRPNTASNNPPIRDAPRIPERPYLAPIDRQVGKKPELVPITIGSFPPILPKG